MPAVIVMVLLLLLLVFFTHHIGGLRPGQLQSFCDVIMQLGQTVVDVEVNVLHMMLITNGTAHVWSR